MLLGRGPRTMWRTPDLDCARTLIGVPMVLRAGVRHVARRLAFVLQIDPDVFALHAQDNGWTEIEIEENDDEDLPTRLWRVPQGGEVRFVNDTAIECQYVEIDVKSIDSIENSISEEFTCYDRQDCVDILDLSQPEETVCHALRLLTCTAPGEVDQQVIDATVEALRDERESVRVTAIQIPTYTRWPEFLPEVTRLAKSDPSKRVQGFAGNAKLILELTQRTASRH